MNKLHRIGVLIVAAVVLLQYVQPVSAWIYYHPPYGFYDHLISGGGSYSIDATTGRIGVKAIDIGYAKAWVGEDESIWVGGNHYTIWKVSFRGGLDAYLKAPGIGYSALEVWLCLMYDDDTILDYEVVYQRFEWWGGSSEVDEYFSTGEEVAYLSDYYAQDDYHFTVLLYGISTGTAGGRVVKDAGTTDFADLLVSSISTEVYYSGPKYL